MSVVIPSATSKITSGFSPTTIPGCQLWLDSADVNTITMSGSNVAQWNDKSGNGRNGAGTGTVGYQSNAINGLSTLSLTGLINSYIRGSISITGTTLTCFAVATMNSATNNYARLLSLGAIGQADYANAAYTAAILRETTTQSIQTYRSSSASPSLAITYNVPFLSACLYDGTNRSIFVNGTGASNASTGTFNISSYQLGAAFTEEAQQRWYGYIGEIIIFNNALTTTQRQQVEGYLATKWGLQANIPATHPYKTILPFVRPLIPTDVGVCEFWFDAADTTTIDSSGGILVTMQNKGTTQGSNVTVNGGSPTTGSVTQNGLNVIRGGSVKFTGAFPTQVRTRFFAVRPTIDTVAGGLNFLGQNTGNTTGYNYAAIYSGLFYEFAAGFRTMMKSVALSNQQNIFSIITTRSASTAANNRLAFTGNPISLTENLSAASYFTGSATNFMGGDHDIGEFISFNSELTDAQTQQIEGYLAWKWGIQSRLPANHLFSKFPPVMPVFAPPQLSNCALWLDAADRSTLTLSGSNVTQWNDKSGNGNNATATGTIPYTATINSVPSLSFTGATSTYLRGSLVNNGTTLTGFCVFVMNPSSQSNARILAVAGAGQVDYDSILRAQIAARDTLGYHTVRTASSVSVVSATLGNPTLTSTEFTGSSNRLYLNGTIGTSVASSGNFGYTQYTVGNSPNEESLVWLNGSIGEIIVYHSSLLPLQRQQVEGYLAHKWGLRANLPTSHPYRLVKP